MLNALNIGSAFRFSRNIVGGLTGFIFSLGNIFKTPFKGSGPAIVVGFLGLSTFILKARENYQLDRQEISTDDYKKNKIQRCSTKLIAAALIKDSQKHEDFQEDKSHWHDFDGPWIIQMSADQKPKIIPVKFSHAQLQPEEILKDLNNKIESKGREAIIRQHLYCTAAFFGQVGSHFMECLLEKTYDKPDLFDFSEFTADNILIVMVSALALYNGYQSFKENHAAYEKAHIDAVCGTALRLSR